MDTPGRQPLRRSLSLITIGGSLAMVFGAGIGGPAYAQFLRTIGATDFHFGLLSGIPMVMLFMQFVGALLADRVRRRKPWFMACLIGGRLVYLPIAFLPLMGLGISTSAVLWSIVVMIGLSSALQNMTGPLWMTWMADLIPRRVLNRYWGFRQRTLQIVWTASFLAVALFTYVARVPILIAFPILATLAVIAGVTDILLFARVREPPNRVASHRGLFAALADTLRQDDLVRFLTFMCCWSAAANFGAAFMQVHVLKNLGLPVWETTLIWCAAGVGMAASSRQWGRLADRHGHRPILVTCMAFKPFIAVVFLLVDSATAPWVLPVCFFVDAFWNAGMGVAENGFMMKEAPSPHRSTFIGAVLGLNGIAGGLGAMLGGAFLHVCDGFSMRLFGRDWGPYHALFAVNLFMRIGCLPLVLRIREPVAAAPARVLDALADIWPMRYVLFPVGLYRRLGRGKT